MIHFYCHKKSVLILILLLLVGLACRSNNIDEIGPPGGSIPVSQEAATRLEQNFQQALQEATTNHESQLRITNQEITSLIAYFGFMNRFNDTMATPLEEEPAAVAGKHATAHGWHIGKHRA